MNTLGYRAKYVCVCVCERERERETDRQRFGHFTGERKLIVFIKALNIREIIIIKY